MRSRVNFYTLLNCWLPWHVGHRKSTVSL